MLRDNEEANHYRLGVKFMRIERWHDGRGQGSSLGLLLTPPVRP
jgi:hypothetical protein